MGIGIPNSQSSMPRIEVLQGFFEYNPCSEGMLPGAVSVPWQHALPSGDLRTNYVLSGVMRGRTLIMENRVSPAGGRWLDWEKFGRIWPSLNAFGFLGTRLALFGSVGLRLTAFGRGA